jgi:hypothetical protein
MIYFKSRTPDNECKEKKTSAKYNYEAVKNNNKNITPNLVNNFRMKPYKPKNGKVKRLKKGPKLTMKKKFENFCVADNMRKWADKMKKDDKKLETNLLIDAFLVSKMRRQGKGKGKDLEKECRIMLEKLDLTSSSEKKTESEQGQRDNKGDSLTWELDQLKIVEGGDRDRAVTRTYPELIQTAIVITPGDNRKRMRQEFGWK